MKTKITGVKELALKNGITIKPTEADLKRANAMIGEIRELEEESNRLYRLERLRYSERLKLSHKISNLKREQELLWGLKPLQTHKEIDKEIGV